MQEVFDKIIEKLDELIDCNPIDGYEKGKNCEVSEAIEIVKQAAAEYYKEKYFNLDNATLHKCPKCGADAEHRVNKKGSWACGCFQCDLFKTSYDHGKAIQAWEDFCSDNNGWIPCSERLPEDGQVVLTCKCKRISILRYSTKTNHWYELSGNWWWSANMVAAWQPLPSPYQYKGDHKKKTNFDRCCESMEAMAQIIDIAKIGWTKEQVMEWLEKEECEVPE